MAKAVLVTKAGSVYDDLPEERYHFPRQYLGRMEACVGDWIVYYEPGRLTVESARREGRRSYFATARVDRIERDQSRPDHFYAFVSDYLEFDRAVPFKEGSHYYESKLGNPDGTTNAGTAQNAVRHVAEHEYDLILQAGFAPLLAAQSNAAIDTASGDLAEEASTFERPIVERLIARPFRDAAFAIAVKAAYRETCAITGLKIINGGGRAEVQAAHIRPVADRGPELLAKRNSSLRYDALDVRSRIDLDRRRFFGACCGRSCTRYHPAPNQPKWSRLRPRES